MFPIDGELCSPTLPRKGNEFFGRTASAALTASACALFGISATFLTAAAILSQMNSAPQIRVDLDRWSWVKELKFDYERIAVKEEAPPALPQPIHLTQATPTKKDSTAIRRIHRDQIRHSVAKAIRVSAPAPGVVAVPVAKPASVIAATAPLRVTKPEIAHASESDLAKMQQMHSFLHSRFLIALNIQPAGSPQTDTQVVAAPPMNIQKKSLEPQKPEKKIRVVAPVAQITEKDGEDGDDDDDDDAVPALPAIAQAPIQQEVSQFAAPSKMAEAAARAVLPSVKRDVAEEAISSPDIIRDEMKITQSAPSQEEPKEDRNEPIPAEQPEAQAPVQTMEQAKPSSTPAVTPSADAGTSFVGYSIASNAGYSAPVMKIGPVNTQSDYSNHTQPPLPSDPKARGRRGLSKPGANPDTDWDSFIKESGFSMLAATPEAEVPAEAAPYIEAFDWKTPVVAASREYVTKESRASDGSQYGWQIAQSSEYWPTLFWQGQAPAKKVSAPLISRNTAKLLEKLAGTSLQPETGIVFGKISNGARIDFSGRAERVLYFDAQNHVINGTDLTGAHSFALLNAAPGARMIYTSASTGVAVPVLTGTASYVDLTKFAKFVVRGQVLDGSAQTQKPIRGARVSVAGIPSASVETDANGAFDLGTVAGIEGFPMYLETEMTGRYTHRYRVDTGKTGSVKLFRMSNAQIDMWISQLEGGISNQSALVLAALPDLMSTSNDPQYFASVRSLAAMPTLAPETYTLAPTGQLEVNTPIQRQQPRFLSVQIPEGPAIAQLEDKGKRIFWSEMVMASPNVVNLIGPY